MVLACLLSGRVNVVEVTELVGGRRGSRCSNHQQVLSHVEGETLYRKAEGKKIPGNKQEVRECGNPT